MPYLHTGLTVVQLTEGVSRRTLSQSAQTIWLMSIIIGIFPQMYTGRFFQCM